MGNIHARKYESLQKERFDTLFNHVLTSYALTNETSHQLKATRVLIENLSDQIDDLNKQFEHALIRYGKDYSNELGQINHQYQDAVKREESLYAESLKQLKRNYQDEAQKSAKALELLHQSFQKVTAQTNIDVKRALIDMKQRHQELDFEYDKAKLTYRKAISELEDQRVSKHEEIQIGYENSLKDNKAQDQVRQFELTQELQRLSQERLVEQADFDESVLKIKTIFNRVTIKFNQKILLYQKTYNKKIDLLKLELRSEIKTLNDEIDTIKDLYTAQDNTILERFKEALLKCDKRMDTIKTEYQARNDAIIKAYARDITVNNSRLASYKELNQTQQKELETNTFTQRANLDKEDINYKETLSGLNQAYLRNKRQLEKDIRLKIKETAQLNKKRTKDHQKDLLKSEFTYIQSQETLRLKIKVLQAQKQHELNLNKLDFNTKYQSVMAKIKLLERQFFLFNQTTQKEEQGPAIYPYESEALLIRSKQNLKNKSKKDVTPFNQNHVLDIYLYESEVLLSREIYDAEMSYRTLENNYFKQSQSLKERKTHITSDLKEITIRYEKDRLGLHHDYELKQTDLVSYLNMEYQKNDLVGFSKIIAEKKKEHELYYHKHELNFFYNQDIEKEKRASEQKIINFKQRLYQQMLEVKENKALIDHDATIELAKSNYTREIGIRKAKRIIDTSLNETQRQRRIFDIYFQMLLAVLSEQENFVMLFRDIYQTSNTKEFHASIDHLKTILADQKTFKNDIIMALEAEAISYYQEKINELTAFKYMNLQESILEDYESEKKIYDDEIKSLDNQLKVTRAKVAELYQQIAVLQNTNDNIRSTKAIINKQIQQISQRMFSKQQRKTVNNLKKELRATQKEIVKNNTDIKHIKMQVDQATKEMQVINSNFKPLKQNLVKIEQNRIEREKNLKKNQYLEGKVYYDAISSIKKLMIHIKQSMDNQYMVIYDAFDHIDEEGMTDKVFNNYYQNISKKSLKLHAHLQDYHKSGVKLCDQQHLEIKKEQQRIIHEYDTSYRLTSSNIRITTEKRQMKMHKKALELEKYQKSFMAIQAKQLLNQKHIITMHFKDRMEQIDEQLKQAHNHINKAYESKNALLEATTANINMVVADQTTQFKHALSELEHAYTVQHKDFSKKIQDIDHELSQSEALFNEKINFYAQKEKRARKRVQERLFDNRVNYRKKFASNRLLVDTLEVKTSLSTKHLIGNQKRKSYFMTKQNDWGLMPLKLDTTFTIYKRKRQARQLWQTKQNKLNQS